MRIAAVTIYQSAAQSGRRMRSPLASIYAATFLCQRHAIDDEHDFMIIAAARHDSCPAAACRLNSEQFGARLTMPRC